VDACHDVSEGGLAVAVAEMAIAGGLGATIDMPPHPNTATAWFAESLGRLVVEVHPDNLARFFDHVGLDDALEIGSVTRAGAVVLDGVRIEGAALRTAWKGPHGQVTA
jgi:phosphoribosylformylglycinamidine synthase